MAGVVFYMVLVASSILSLVLFGLCWLPVELAYGARRSLDAMLDGPNRRLEGKETIFGLCQLDVKLKRKERCQGRLVCRRKLGSGMEFRIRNSTNTTLGCSFKRTETIDFCC